MTDVKQKTNLMADLEERIAVLEKINHSLMGRVERSVDSSANSFNLFESNIVLKQAVTQRTKELQAVNEKLRQEISDRKEAEKRVVTELEEKEVLLKEIHHRVKNNLQIITSLLDLQSRRIFDKGTRDMFQESQTRVKSMALIHERLYRSHNLARVNLRDYVTDLTKYLLSTFTGRNQLVSIGNEVEAIELPVDQAVPCGLIVNELVCNSLKYAFPDDQTGRVTIAASMLEDDMLQLSVADTGVGLPDDFNPEQAETLGQRLVTSLVRQLCGSLHYEANRGTRITVRFPIQDKETNKEPVQCPAQKC